MDECVFVLCICCPEKKEAIRAQEWAVKAVINACDLDSSADI
jgi:hypothetical protein